MLEEKSVIGYWTVKTSEKLWQTKILALAENSEKILYSLDRRFGQGDTPFLRQHCLHKPRLDNHI